ncbi:MAG: pyridoxal-dependent decarboxylase [Acidobacteria bacterium]|nr:pyridoxal-dependent decarboxylase [Acidobacteriota bacterium]
MKKSSYHLSHGVGKLYQEFPPTIFVSGTAHYSLHKAADLLGIGRANIQFVSMTSGFRMDVNDLEKRIKHAVADNKIPLAVIPIVGTTEEGAVDPVHEILDLRRKFEKEQNLSFWVHVDAAWGGYFRSLFNLSSEDEIQAILEKASSDIEGMKFTTIEDWHKDFFNYVNVKVNENYPETLESEVQSQNIQKKEDAENKRKKILHDKLRLESFLEKNNFEQYIKIMKKLVFENTFLGLNKDIFELTLNDRIKLLNDYISDIIPLNYDSYRNNVNFKWGSKDLCSAFVAMSSADSITIDPHKMGYINYPCGMVAFRNDRIRHFILQKAPYITSIRQEILVHMPPRHVDENTNKIVTEAFAPFILEGSRPGAAASSLWLTIKTIPPTMKESGLIIKSSLIASRELYEWLIHWEKIMSFNRKDTEYQFIPLTEFPPDTNVVIFGIRKKAINSLIKMNELTKKVYDAFTIQSELGENQYSYGQAFFLSKTEFQEPIYPLDTLKPLFSKYFPEHLERVYNEYKKEGLVVLRATLMNPYIWMMRNMSNQNFIKEFMQELSKAAEKSSREL